LRHILGYWGSSNSPTLSSIRPQESLPGATTRIACACAVYLLGDCLVQTERRRGNDSAMPIEGRAATTQAAANAAAKIRIMMIATPRYAPSLLLVMRDLLFACDFVSRPSPARLSRARREPEPSVIRCAKPYAHARSTFCRPGSRLSRAGSKEHVPLSSVIPRVRVRFMPGGGA
jgi:hypothetical protein